MTKEKTAGMANELFVAGVGISDKGTEALATFLATLPANVQNVCLVIAWPLGEEQKKNLARMIIRKTGWTFKEAKNGEVLRSGNIYVVKSGKEIEISGNKLKLTDAKAGKPDVPSINKFFHSLAAEKGSKAIAIILSGLEGEEITGVKAVKEAGGLTVGQLSESHSNKHVRIPASAIKSDYDSVVMPEEISAEIIHYINNYQVVKKTGKHDSNIDNIFELLEYKTGTNFSLYKQSTIMRRIQKRLEALNLKNVDIYYRYITKHPKELDILFATVLIGVTEFFRDQDAFDILKGYLAEIIRKKKPGDRIRIWVAGCATGEEAYSIAIVLAELLKNDLSHYNIQIFATDIDEKAINKGRKGIYPEQSLHNLSEKLRQKYFEKAEFGYEVKKYLRQLVLFSKHDVTADPPFVRLDLVSCRNLLIYFNSDLQKEVLKIFHYALNKEGYLFLGKSESAGTTGLFQQTDGKNKVFNKTVNAHAYTLKFSKFRSRLSSDNDSSETQVTEDMSLTDLAKETLFQTYEHPFVIINNNLQIKEVHGSVRLYLEISGGGINDNILKMINPELELDMRSLIARIQKDGGALSSSIIKFHLFDQDHFVRLHVRQVVHKINKSGYYLVIFEKINFDPKYSSVYDKEISSDEITNMKIRELEHELSVAREHLQTFTEELETSNEELQSLNEELQSANEELKSSNEELETSNEELQSANEELHTANSELRLSNQALIEKEEELQASKNELEKSERLYRTLAENYPNGIIGILNQELRLEFVAGEGLKRFYINNEDVLGTKMFEKGTEPAEYDKIKKIFRATFKGKNLSTRLKYRDRSYILNTIPLRTSSPDIDKIMYVTQDVTDMDVLLSRLAETEKRFRNLADTAPVMIWMSGGDKKCTYLNQQWLDFTGHDLAEDLGDGWITNVHPDDLDKCVRTYNSAFDARKPFTVDYRLKRNDGEYRWVTNKGIPRYENEHFMGYIGACSDIHDKKLAEEEVKMSMIYFRSMVESLPQMAWTALPDGKDNFFNKKWYEYTGLSGQSSLEDGWKKVVHPHDIKKMNEKKKLTFTYGASYENELRIKRADGSYRWHIVRALPVKNDQDEVFMWVGTCTDIHDQKMVEKNKDEFMNIASHELKTPLTSLKAYVQLIDNVLSEKEELREESVLVREYNTKASYSVEKLHELINNLLDVSKIEAGKMKMVFNEIDFDEMVYETVKDFQLSCPTHKIMLEGKTGATIKGSKARIEQVIYNILSNAVKYSPQKDRVLVNLKREKNFVILYVKDEGIGLSSGHEKKIFKRFFRVEDSERVGGLGLGLYICKEIVSRHGGEIWAESQEGKGTEVHIKLPAFNLNQ